MTIRNRYATGVLIVMLLLLGGRASAATRIVNIGPNQTLTFQDSVSKTSTTTINVGDTVQWIWQGMHHSTTSGNCATGTCIPGALNGISWDSGVHDSPNTFSFTFTKAGSFPYFCSIHGTTFGMRGLVNVVVPDFALQIPNTTIGPIFPGQTAAFNGTLTTSTGYSNNVNLSCKSVGSPLPGICTPNPQNPVPSPNATQFTITAGDATAQNFQFEVQAIGSDVTHITHLSPLLTLKIVDYAESAPSPSSVTVASNATSPPVSFAVTGLNGFTGVVNLNCGGLPAGASCNFLPSSTLDFSKLTNPVQASVTVTTVHTSQGSYTVTVSATDSADNQVRSQTFGLNVQADYALALSNPVVTVFPGQSGSFNGLLMSLDGYTGTITITCGSPPFDPNATCTPPASPITLNGNAMFPVGISTNSVIAPGDHSANISASDGKINHQQSATLRVVDFSVTPPSVSAVEGNPSTPATVQVNSLGQFAGKVALSCPTPPAGFICSFSPAEVALQSEGTANVTLVVSTPQNSAAGSPHTLNLSANSINSGAPAEISHSANFSTTVSVGTGTADLAVALSHSQPPPNSPAAVGGAVTYIAQGTNNSPGSVSATVVITFSEPVLIGTLPAQCTQANGIVTCAFTSTNGTPNTFSIPVIAPFTRNLTANAFVSSGAADTDSTNNSASDVVEIRLRPLSRNGLPIGIP